MKKIAALSLAILLAVLVSFLSEEKESVYDPIKEKIGKNVGKDLPIQASAKSKKMKTETVQKNLITQPEKPSKLEKSDNLNIDTDSLTAFKKEQGSDYPVFEDFSIENEDYFLKKNDISESIQEMEQNLPSIMKKPERIEQYIGVFKGEIIPHEDSGSLIPKEGYVAVLSLEGEVAGSYLLKAHHQLFLYTVKGERRGYYEGKGGVGPTLKSDFSSPNNLIFSPSSEEFLQLFMSSTGNNIIGNYYMKKKDKPAKLLAKIVLKKQ